MRRAVNLRPMDCTKAVESMPEAAEEEEHHNNESNRNRIDQGVQNSVDARANCLKDTEAVERLGPLHSTPKCKHSTLIRCIMPIRECMYGKSADYENSYVE